jgi:aminoglycoside phosphotransferase (APT) family kinase protein
MNTAESFLVSNWKRLRLDGPKPPAQLSSVLATPRFRASRHVVFLILADGYADPKWVAKIPRLADETASLEREAANLRALCALRFGGFENVPRLLAYESYLGNRLLLESAVSGYAMRPAVVRQRPTECCEAAISWLVDLHEASFQRHHDRATSFQRLVAGLLDYFECAFPLSTQEKQLVAETRHLTGPLRSLDFPLVFEHGDFSSPNILMRPGGDVGVVDWELAEPHGLPAVDLFFFLNYLAFARNQAETPEDCVGAFHDAFFGPQAWAREYVARYGEALGLPVAALRPLFIACWSRYVAGLVGRLNDLGAEPRAEPDPETTAWLRNNRYFHLWRHAVQCADDLRLAD